MIRHLSVFNELVFFLNELRFKSFFQDLPVCLIQGDEPAESKSIGMQKRFLCKLSGYRSVALFSS